MPKAKKKNGRGVRHRAPPTYWDKLSYVPFVKGALEEFDRRSKQPFSPLPPLSCRLREDRIPKLKLFAKHGGPDLSVLRGVSFVKDLFTFFAVPDNCASIQTPMKSYQICRYVIQVVSSRIPCPNKPGRTKNPRIPRPISNTTRPSCNISSIMVFASK